MTRRLLEACDGLEQRILLFLWLQLRLMHSVGGGGLLNSFCRYFGRWWMVLVKVSQLELGDFRWK